MSERKFLNQVYRTLSGGEGNIQINGQQLTKLVHFIDTKTQKVFQMLFRIHENKLAV